MIIVTAGTSLTLRATFKDKAGQPKDPTTVALRVRRPGGQVDPYTTGFVHPSPGVYERDYMVDAPGDYWVQWASTGDPAVVGEAPVRVRATRVAVP